MTCSVCHGTRAAPGRCPMTGPGGPLPAPPVVLLVRILANIALLPSAVLRDAGTVVAGVVPGMQPTPAPAPTRRTPAATDPTPTAPVPTVAPAEAAPTTPAAPPCTGDVPEPTRDSDLLEQTIGLEPTQLRYPAPKRSVAKKRR